MDQRQHALSRRCLQRLARPDRSLLERLHPPAASRNIVHPRQNGRAARPAQPAGPGLRSRDGPGWTHRVYGPIRPVAAWWTGVHFLNKKQTTKDTKEHKGISFLPLDVS